MYASMDFATKGEFRQAVKQGMAVVAYSPIMGMPVVNGNATVFGPWPMHTAFECNEPVFGPQLPPRHCKIRGWQARVEVKDMRVVAVH